MQNTSIILIIAAIIVIAMIILSRRSVIRITKPDTPEYRSKRTVQDSNTKNTGKPVGKGAGERINGGVIIMVGSRDNGTITIVETALPAKLKLPQAISLDMRGDNIDFGRLVTTLKERNREELDIYKSILPELQSLIRNGANYINAGPDIRKITVEFPVPPDSIPEEQITDIGKNLIRIRDKLSENHS